MFYVKQVLPCSFMYLHTTSPTHHHAISCYLMSPYVANVLTFYLILFYTLIYHHLSYHIITSSSDNFPYTTHTNDQKYTKRTSDIGGTLILDHCNHPRTSSYSKHAGYQTSWEERKGFNDCRSNSCFIATSLKPECTL